MAGAIPAVAALHRTVDERHRWEADLSARNLMRAMVGLKRSRWVEDRGGWW